MSLSAETQFNVFEVGSCPMINLSSMIGLFLCRGKVQAYHYAFLVADHSSKYTHLNMSSTEEARVPNHGEARNAEVM